MGRYVLKHNYKHEDELTILILIFANSDFLFFTYFSVKYYFTETLNLINVFGQYWLTNAFLGYQFWQVGYVSWKSVHELDVTVLPTMASCRVVM